MAEPVLTDDLASHRDVIDSLRRSLATRLGELKRLQPVYDAAVKWRPTVSIDTMTDSEWTLAAAVIAAEEK